MEIKKHTNKILVFFINILLIVIAVLVVKDKSKSQFVFEDQSNTQTDPVDSSILDLQNVVATYRENKLRHLNTSPKKIEQKKTTTTTTITTPDPKPASQPSRTTRTS